MSGRDFDREERESPEYKAKRSRYLETMKAMDELALRKDQCLQALVTWMEKRGVPNWDGWEPEEVEAFLDLQNISMEAQKCLGMSIDENVKRIVSADLQEN